MEPQPPFAHGSSHLRDHVVIAHSLSSTQVQNLAFQVFPSQGYPDTLSQVIRGQGMVSVLAGPNHRHQRKHPH